MLAHIAGSNVRCWSRHGTDLTAAVGDVVSELRQLVPDGTLVDGELVALGRAANGDVGQDFDRIAPTVFGRHHHTLTFVVFDAPRLAGEELTGRGTNDAPRRADPHARRPPRHLERNLRA